MYVLYNFVVVCRGLWVSIRLRFLRIIVKFRVRVTSTFDRSVYSIVFSPCIRSASEFSAKLGWSVCNLKARLCSPSRLGNAVFNHAYSRVIDNQFGLGPVDRFVCVLGRNGIKDASSKLFTDLMLSFLVSLRLSIPSDSLNIGDGRFVNRKYGVSE